MMRTITLLCQTASKYYQIQSDLTKPSQNCLISSNLKFMPGGPPWPPKTEESASHHGLLIFAFVQLRADNLKHDPQKCQETPQMTQVENTNHQMYKSFWRQVFNIITFLWNLWCLLERYFPKLLQNTIKFNLIWQNVVKIAWYLQTQKTCPEGHHDLQRQRKVLRTITIRTSIK